MSKDIISKHKVYVVDNINKEKAQYLSIKYPKIIFFTNTGEIYKNGEIYTSILGVNPNYDKIEIGNKVYKFYIENKLLKISLVKSWYWYIGSTKQYQISVVEPETSKSTGWRFITNKPSIIESNIYELTDDLIIWGENNPIYLNNLDLNNNDLYIYLPTDLINNYNVGIYDIFDETNFLNEGGILYKIDEEIIIDNIKYNIYKFIKKPLNTFNLKIYSKKLN